MFTTQRVCATVDKTFEDPAAVHPALRADPAMLQRVEALFKAIEALTTDVNDH